MASRLLSAYGCKTHRLLPRLTAMYPLLSVNNRRLPWRDERASGSGAEPRVEPFYGTPPRLRRAVGRGQTRKRRPRMRLPILEPKLSSVAELLDAPKECLAVASKERPVVFEFRKQLQIALASSIAPGRFDNLV